jgi:DNA topoisomerase-1
MKEDREGQELENTILTLKDGDILSETRLERFGSEKAKLFPTDIGTVVNKFLLEHFADIVDYNFTAKVEKDFDEIAAGNQEWRNVIDRFYIPFHKNIELTQQNSTRTSGSRLVGVDPKTKKNVYAKIGRYGTLVQIGETGGDDKPLFASMKRGQSIESITLEEALELFALPRNLGAFEGKEMTVSIGKYGPYVRLGNEFFSLSKNDDPYTITTERCIAIIKSKREADMEKQRIKSIFPLSLGTLDGEPVTINNGRYGFYLSHGSENYHLSKNIDPETLTLEQAKEIIEKKAKGASAK